MPEGTVWLERELLTFSTIVKEGLPLGSLSSTRDWSKWSIWWYDTGRRVTGTYDEMLAEIGEITNCRTVRSTVGTRH